MEVDLAHDRDHAADRNIDEEDMEHRERKQHEDIHQMIGIVIEREKKNEEDINIMIEMKMEKISTESERKKDEDIDIVVEVIQDIDIRIDHIEEEEIKVITVRVIIIITQKQYL